MFTFEGWRVESGTLGKVGMMRKRVSDQGHDYEDAMRPSFVPDRTIQTSSFYANGVKLQKAQRRAAHAGVPISHMIEPQRGSTNYYQNALGLVHCGTPLGVRNLLSFSTQCCAVRHWPAFLTKFLLRSEISALVRTSLDSRLCRVSTQLHPRSLPEAHPSTRSSFARDEFCEKCGLGFGVELPLQFFQVCLL